MYLSLRVNKVRASRYLKILLIIPSQGRNISLTTRGKDLIYRCIDIQTQKELRVSILQF